jgi:hypothetical protein
MWESPINIVWTRRHPDVAAHQKNHVAAMNQNKNTRKKQVCGMIPGMNKAD